MKRYLILAILILLLAIPAVSAYEIHSVYNNTGSTASTWEPTYLPSNTRFGNLTIMSKMDYSGIGYDYGRPSSSASGEWRVGSASGPKAADGTISWSTECRTNYNCPMTVNYTFTGWTQSPSNTSLVALYFKNGTSPYYNPVSYIAGAVSAGGYYAAPKIYFELGSKGVVHIYSGTAIPPGPPTAGYTCNVDPTYPYEPNPFSLVCVDNSTASPAITALHWTITQPDATTYTTSNATLVRTLLQDGWYGLDYAACNANGCGFANTSHLVNLTTGYIPTTGISFWAHAYDPLKSAKIAGATVGIQNLTSGTWRNLSTSDGSARFTSTDYYLKEKLTAGQTVGLMASASGYITANTTVTIPYDGWEYLINLVATGDVPTGANATLYVNVIDAHTMKGLSGATVTISNTSIPYSSSKLSNTGGIATFPNIASGTYSIVATKTGYTSSTVSWPAGASAVTNAYMSLLPTGATPVVTGTGGNPLFDGDGNPIVGYDLDGNPITAGPTPDTRTAEEKDDEMMDMLRDQGPMLIQFFIVCFVVYMVMGMAGRGGR